MLQVIRYILSKGAYYTTFMFTIGLRQQRISRPTYVLTNTSPVGVELELALIGSVQY